MRFNAPEHLEAYKTSRTYPKIHDAVFAAIAEEMDEGPCCDLMASTGLLGRRVRDLLDWPCCATDGDEKALEAGSAAGVYKDDYPVKLLKLTPASMGELSEWLCRHEVTNLLARRCLCVLTEQVAPEMIREVLAASGVTGIVLEGQANVGRNVHPYGMADAQVAYLEPCYRLRWARKDVRYLTLV